MSFWSDLKERLTSLLEAGWTYIGSISSHPVRVIVVSIFAVLTAIPFYMYSEEIFEFLNRAKDGEIIVNSPTVYTRQRLVNDRLEQVRWLKDQLEITENDQNGFRIIDGAHYETNTWRATAQLDTVPSTRLGLPPSGQAKGLDKDTDLINSRDPAPDSMQVVPTTTDLFRAKEAFREEVRGLMTETQLDDRHDILGNTIFRMTFPATVIAGNIKNRLAVVQVSLGHYPSEVMTCSAAIQNPEAKKVVTEEDTADWLKQAPIGSDCKETESQSSAMEQLYKEDYDQLYFEWIRYQQKLLSDSVTSIAMSITKGFPDTRLELLYSELLITRISQFLCNKLDGIGKFSSDASHLCGYENKERAKYLAQFLWDKYSTEKFKNIKDNDTKKFERQLDKRKYNKKDYKDLYIFANQHCEEQRIQKFKLNDISYLMNGPPAIQDDKSKNNKKHLDYDYIDCPYSVDSLARMQIGTTLYYDFLKHQKKHTENFISYPIESSDKAGKPIDKAGERIDQLVQEWISHQPDTTPYVPHVVSDEAVKCFAADFILSNLDGFGQNKLLEWKKLGYYLELKNVGSEIGRCGIRVSAKESVSSKGPHIKPSQELAYRLNKGVEVFAYSVTPKHLTDNVATGNETKALYQIALSAGKGASGAGSIIDALKERTVMEGAIRENPIVVGFGSSVQAPDKVRYEKDEHELSAVTHHTKFGWIIAPKFQTGKQYEQMNDQYPLTAVVSAPSWWRSAAVEITTCWIKPGNIDEESAQSGEICQQKKADLAGNGNTITTVVRLPVAIAELSRKLGFEVVQEPYIVEEAPQTLVIGQPGALKLRGARLWRSTEVTLGAQTATSISVLPNMEGIIANFDCVWRPSILKQSPDKRVVLTPAVIWTSEGVTSAININLLGDIDGPDGCPRDGAPPPDNPIKQGPLLPDQPPSALLIGQPGSLMILGSRLSDGAVVTLGSQSATSITVLPNMQGIVAQFDCVYPPSPESRGPDGKYNNIPVTVWTEEGPTPPFGVTLMTQDGKPAECREGAAPQGSNQKSTP